MANVTTNRRGMLRSFAILPVVAVSGGAVAATPVITVSARSILDFIPTAQHGAIQAGRSDFDCAPSIRTAMFTVAGGPLHFPTGTYAIGSSIKMMTDTGNAAFGPGAWISGDGIGRTIFDNRAGDGPMFDVATLGDRTKRFTAALGIRFEGFSIISRARGVTTTAVRLRSAYNARLFQLHISGQGGDGIAIPCHLGDLDGSNMIALEQVRIENCGGWGIDSACDPGFNENSFIRLQQVFIQNCGRASDAATPSSGGMRHKGQVLSLDQCAFTINENVALYVPGQAGLAQTIDISSTAFENNRRRHILCTGVSGFKARNIQFYSNDAHQVQVACEFSGARNTVRFVDIDGVAVRATAGNKAMTAFRFSGENLESNSCRVRNVIWENYDYPGQTRFEGVMFDTIPRGGDLIATDGQTLLFKPSKIATTPLRLRGRGTSAGGEWAAMKIPVNGVYIGNAGLLPSMRYEAYLYDKNAVMALELSRAAPERDKVSGYGVKSGDNAKLHVGSVMTDSAGKFVRTGAGWLNPVMVPGNAPGRFMRLWTDSAGRLRMLDGVDPRSDMDGRVAG